VPSRLFTRPVVPALILWGFALLAMFLIVDLYVMPWAAGKFRPVVTVPSVAGLRPEAARDTLGERGLRFAVDTAGDYSRLVPAGRVLAQTPDSGSRVKQGRRVWVTLSLGREPAVFPVRGR
jgi:hypothetical protein